MILINSNKLEPGEWISIRAAVVSGPQTNGYVWVEIGESFHRTKIPVHEKNIFGRVPDQRIEVGDDVKWNSTYCNVRYIEDDYALVKLYMSSDITGYPSGSLTGCMHYKQHLVPMKRV